MDANLTYVESEEKDTILVYFMPDKIFQKKHIYRQNMMNKHNLKLKDNVDKSGQPWLNIEYNYIINMDINSVIFPVHILSLVRKIKRPDDPQKFYQDHFFVSLIKSILENRQNPNDSAEILAIKINDGNPEMFYYLFYYLQLANEDDFKLDNNDVEFLLSLYRLASYYEIDGLKEIILSSFNACFQEEIYLLRNGIKKRRLPVNIQRNQS